MMSAPKIEILHFFQGLAGNDGNFFYSLPSEVYYLLPG